MKIKYSLEKKCHCVIHKKTKQTKNPDIWGQVSSWRTKNLQRLGQSALDKSLELWIWSTDRKKNKSRRRMVLKWTFNHQ